jgi:uncharacterized protein (TIGR03086 family)
MRDVALLSKAAARWTELVDMIGDDDWSRATPCEGWTVRDLLVHVIERDRGLAAQMDGAPRDDDRLRRSMAGEYVTLAEDDDLKQCWHEQWDWWRSRMNDAAIRDTVRRTPLGEMTFPAAAARLNTMELTVHGWDLARGLRADDRIDPELVAYCLPIAEAVDRDRLPPGVMAPPLSVASDADAQQRLLALVGRRG